MPRLLQIHASLNREGSHSSRLVDAYAQAWLARHPDGETLLRDLGRDPLPHLDAARFGAFLKPAAERNAYEAAVVAESDALIAELDAADAVVLGLPMYNFGVPSQLKSWFDHLARAGVSFRYTADGPVGLLRDKPVTVFAARGGRYAGTPHDTQTPYVSDFFRFIGITQLEFVHAEGLNLGDTVRDTALAAARARIDQLIPSLPLAA